ncbi:radical SAM protein [Lysinibacillus xylanilyticus]|uniref:radical SAM protein n=1 Tax=Lysinibacillus xylanilyticus TaxID=582475 RepID=UPI0037F1BAD8
MLNNNQINQIKEIDSPILTKKSDDISTIKMRGEDEVTGLISNEELYLFKRFLIDDKYFVYITSTNMVHEINNLEYQILEYGFDIEPWSLKEKVDIRDCSQADIVISCKRLKDLFQPINKEGYVFAQPNFKRKTEKFEMKVLLINTTEDCNLRCTYCYFGGAYDDTRVHRKLKADIEDLKPILEEFVLSNKNVEKQRAIYFFGGEPLLNFKLIKDVVNYIDEISIKYHINIENILYQIATNGTVLNSRMMEFFKEKDFYINVSMDGPNHDKYRLDKVGNGTLDLVTKKLKWVSETYPEYYSTHFGIVCVITPPYKIPLLYDFFTKWEPATTALHLDFDMILPGNEIGSNYYEELCKAKDDLWEIFTKTHAYSEEEKQTSSLYFFSTGFNFLHKAFSSVTWRPINTIQSKLNKLNGMDEAPGVHITTIGADGTIYSSYEHQHEDYKIGHLNDGISKEQVNNIIENFQAFCNTGSCSKCWASRLCKIDYPEFYISNSDDEDKIKAKLEVQKLTCKNERYDTYSALKANKEIELRFGKKALDYMETSLEEHQIYF